MSVQITAMAIDDYDDAVALWQATENVGLHLEDADFAAAGVEAYLARNPGLSFVARRDGVLVGAVLCGHDGRRGYLHHLAVAADRRRQGIGRELVRRCLGRLRQVGIRKCHLMLFAANAQGRAFWRAIGWGVFDDVRFVSCSIPDTD